MNSFFILNEAKNDDEETQLKGLQDELPSEDEASIDDNLDQADSDNTDSDPDDGGAGDSADNNSDDSTSDDTVNPSPESVEATLYKDEEIILDNLIAFTENIKESINNIKQFKVDQNEEVNEIYKRATNVLEKINGDILLLIKKFKSIPIKTIDDLYKKHKQTVMATLNLLEQHIDNDESESGKAD